MIPSKSIDFSSPSLSTIPGPRISFNTEIEDIAFDINVQNETFLRYKADDKQDVESFYKAGSIVNIKASKSIIIWLSNAGAVNFNFKNYSKILNPGEVGKIEVKLVKWVQSSGSEYELQISNLK